MPPVVSDQLLSRLFEAVDAIKAAIAVPPALPRPQPEGALWVDPEDGDDGNDGRDRTSPFRTLARAVQALTPRSALVLMNGIWAEPLRLHDLGTSRDAPVYIKAEQPGDAVMMGTALPLSDGTAPWRHVGAGLYATPFPGRPWAGYGGDRFLFSYKSLADLEAGSVAGRNKPPYGLAWQDGQLYLRLPEGADPAGQAVHVPPVYARPLIEIRRSPYVILDGVGVMGAGNTFAIDADEASHHLWLQNIVCDLSRMLVRLPSDSMVRWNEYRYRGFLPFAEDVIEANGGQIKALFDLVKDYNIVGSDAHYEGRIAASFDNPSRRCRFERNFYSQIFDGNCLGRFSDSVSFREVFASCFDDAYEVESWRKTHDSAKLAIIEPLILNVFGSAVSHQDSARQIRGPHRIERAIIDNPHPRARPAYLIKNMGPMPHHPAITYDRCFFRNLSGPTGWGAKANFLYLDHEKGKGARLSIRNSIVVVDRLDDWAKDWDPDLDYNVLVSPVDYPHIRGPHGRWHRSIDELKLRGVGEHGVDHRPLPGSPLIGAGENGVTIGPYDIGDELRHRPMVTTFTDEVPEPWAAL
jgi:hypothetical protein